MSKHPSDWTRTTFGNVLLQRKEAGFTNEELLAVTSSLGVVKRDTLERRDTSNEDKRKYLLVKKGDIAYNTMRMWQGVSGVSRFRGIVSPAYTICTPSNELDADFAGYMLKDPQMVSVFRQRSQGLVSDTWNLKYQSFAQIPCLLPPLPEQKKIAEILSGIDQEIIRIQQQIASLEVLRTAILEQSLEQLKDCPIHPLHEITKKVTVGIVSKPADHYVSKGVPTLRSMNIKEGKIDYKDLRFISEESNHFFKKSIIREGDILTVRTGAPGTSAVAPADIDGANCVDIIISTPAEGVDSHFLCLQINSDRIKSKVLSGQGGLAQQHFNIGEMRVLDILLPSLDTQKEISSAVLSVSQCIASRCKQKSKYECVKSAVAQDLLSGRKRVSV